MDIVYILGSGSRWDNNEIRYSLRSLQHFPHHNVVVVGEKPEWMQNIIHIEMDDPYSNINGGKFKNVIRKTLAACLSDKVSDDFVLMNDDFFFLKDTLEIEPRSLGPLDLMIEDFEDRYGDGGHNQYINMLIRTQKFLLKKGIENPISYGVHYPIVYNKHKFLQMMSEIDWQDKAYSWRTLYGNLFSIGNIPKKDFKIGSVDAIDGFLLNKDNLESDFLSISDNVACDLRFQDWIKERFPNKSKYEV